MTQWLVGFTQISQMNQVHSLQWVMLNVKFVRILLQFLVKENKISIQEIGHKAMENYKLSESIQWSITVSTQIFSQSKQRANSETNSFSF